MRVTGVTTTPNPNSLMLNVADVGDAWPVSVTYTRAAGEQAPAFVARLLAVAGVRSVFLGPGFITLSRDPTADWEPILEAATAALVTAAGGGRGADASHDAAGGVGEVQVAVQVFRGVPIQVKATEGAVEERAGLPARFADAAKAIRAATGAAYLRERRWADRGVRYGEPAAVATAVAQELDAVIDERDLARLVAAATGARAATTPPTPAELRADLAHDDWRRRLRAVQSLGSDPDAVPLLAGALADPQPQVRRMAAASLGATARADAVAPLCGALTDPDVGVRRTAGDSLSDLGDVTAEPAVCRALADPSRLVRWRAARFLAEAGTAAALPALEAVADDPEFEVRLEVAAAITRIRGGEPGAEPVWKRIAGGE